MSGLLNSSGLEMYGLVTDRNSTATSKVAGSANTFMVSGAAHLGLYSLTTAFGAACASLRNAEAARLGQIPNNSYYAIGCVIARVLPNSQWHKATHFTPISGGTGMMYVDQPEKVTAIHWTGFARVHDTVFGLYVGTQAEVDRVANNFPPANERQRAEKMIATLAKIPKDPSAPNGDQITDTSAPAGLNADEITAISARCVRADFSGFADPAKQPEITRFLTAWHNPLYQRGANCCYGMAALRRDMADVNVQNLMYSSAGPMVVDRLKALQSLLCPTTSSKMGSIEIARLVAWFPDFEYRAMPTVTYTVKKGFGITTLESFKALAGWYKLCADSAPVQKGLVLRGGVWHDEADNNAALKPEDIVSRADKTKAAKAIDTLIKSGFDVSQLKGALDSVKS